MSNEVEKVTLENIGGGAAAEQWQENLKRVLENIQDPNTKAKAKRQIILTVTLIPDEKRNYSQIEIDCKSKLAAIAPHQTGVYIGKVMGETIATEYNPKQPVFTEMEQEEKVN